MTYAKITFWGIPDKQRDSGKIDGQYVYDWWWFDWIDKLKFRS